MTNSITVPEFADALIELLKHRPGQNLTADSFAMMLRQIVPAAEAAPLAYPRYSHCQSVVNFAPEYRSVLVQSKSEEDALGPGWGPTPARTHAEGYPRYVRFYFTGVLKPEKHIFGDPSNPGLPPVEAYSEEEREKLLVKGFIPSLVLVNSEQEHENLLEKVRKGKQESEELKGVLNG
jgi:hypothetical protein